MRIFTKLSLNIEDGSIIENETEWYDYLGPVDMLCGATSAQTTLQTQQMSAYQQMQSQASEEFGQANTVFQSLQNSFAPTVAAGPSQMGYSPAELSALNSAAITNTGTSYANAKAATGEALAGQSGGNTALPSGTTAGIDENLAASAANQTSSELNQIQQAGYAQGNANYNTAVQGLANSTGVFGTANSAGNVATGAGGAAGTTANQVAQANNSWVGAVTGALGSIGGAAMSGLMSPTGAIGSLTSGLGGGGSLNMAPTITAMQGGSTGSPISGDFNVGSTQMLQ